jgi:hypothetical protein
MACWRMEARVRRNYPWKWKWEVSSPQRGVGRAIAERVLFALAGCRCNCIPGCRVCACGRDGALIKNGLRAWSLPSVCACMCISLSLCVCVDRV